MHPHWHSPSRNPHSFAFWQDSIPWNLFLPAASPAHFKNATWSQASTGSLPSSSEMLRTASESQAGHNAADFPSAIAWAQASQVGYPHPPNPPQSTPGRSERIRRAVSFTLLISLPPIIFETRELFYLQCSV